MNWLTPIIILGLPTLAAFALWKLNKEESVKAPVKPSPPVGGGDKDTAGKSADGKSKETKPSHDHDHGGHGDDHAHPVTFMGMLQGVLVAALLTGGVVIGCRSCERMAEHRAVAKAIDRESAADPDNWYWELWKVGRDGRMHMIAGGITRETSQVDGRVSLAWRSSKLNGDIKANCVPGQKGLWEVINGQGEHIKKDFLIYTVSNTEIRGHIDGSEEPYDFVFRRSMRKKWN